VRRTMHILGVISYVSRSSKCTKIVGGLGFTPDPTDYVRVIIFCIIIIIIIINQVKINHAFVRHTHNPKN